MRKREVRPIRKHTINLYEGDYEKLQGLYPTKIGAGKIIRDLIHAHIRKIEENATQRQKTAAPLVDDLGVGLVGDEG